MTMQENYLDGVVAIEKGAIGSPSTTVANFTFMFVVGLMFFPLC